MIGFLKRFRCRWGRTRCCADVFPFTQNLAEKYDVFATTHFSIMLLIMYKNSILSCFSLAIVSLCFGVNVLGADDGALDGYLDRCAESLSQLRIGGNYFSFTWTEIESQCELLFQSQGTFTRHFSSRSSRERFVRGDDKEYLAVFQENGEFAHVNSMIQTGNVSPGEYAVAENDVAALFGLVKHVKEGQTFYDVVGV